MNQNICFNQTAFLTAIILVTVLILCYNHFFNICPPCKSIIINKTNNDNKKIKSTVNTKTIKKTKKATKTKKTINENPILALIRKQST